MRLCLRVLDSMLGLGIAIPLTDSTSGGAADHIKESFHKETGGVMLDTIVGLAVFPDDENYVECVISGEAEVYPGDPTYVLKALETVWPLEMKFDDRADDALLFLGLSTTEVSPRAKFLMSYMALERMIDRLPRSEAARNLIKDFPDSIELQVCGF